MPGVLLKCIEAMLARRNHEPGAVVGGRAAGSVRVPAGGGTWMAARGPGDHDWFVRSSEGSWDRMGDAAFRNLQGRVADAGGVMVTREVVIEGGERVETVCRTLGHRLDGETRDTPGLARRGERWSEFFFYRTGNPVGYERIGTRMSLPSIQKPGAKAA